MASEFLGAGKYGSIVVEKSLHSHADYISSRLRQIHLEECHIQKAVPWRILHEMVAEDVGECFTLIYNDEPLGITGHTPAIFNEYKEACIGVVWYVGTDVIDKCPHSFYKLSCKVVKYYSNAYDFVTNEVPAHHEETLNWLSSIGCLIADKPHITNGKKMLNFIHCQNLTSNVIPVFEKPDIS